MVSPFSQDRHTQMYDLQGTDNIINKYEKKCLEETQTLCAGCSKAEPKFFAPPQTPSWGCGTAKI